jgi:hypothetical protein
VTDKIQMDETGAFTGSTLHAWEDSQVELWHPDVQSLREGQTLAFVYAGHWAADCNSLTCFGAEKLICCGPCPHPQHAGPGRGIWRQATILCPSCGTLSEVIWPTEAEEIDRVLSLRPVPGVRNWAPGGHRQAVVASVTGEKHPMGQTVADLRQENRARNWET